MQTDIPRYLILILSMFNKASGNIEEFNNAIKFLPNNMPLEDYRKAINIIGEYIGMERCKSVPYKEYLLSDWWRSRKAQEIRDAGYRCEQCGSIGRIEVHHKNYKNLGNEKREDLIVMCQACHKKSHRKGKEG